MAVPSSTPASPQFLREDELRRGVELLFFGYTRLTRSIDESLVELGMGRAHHRALYFIARNPGLPVSHLLSILAITKQSLGRVLGDLDKRGLVVSEQGKQDRRQRLLFLTDEGKRLEGELFELLRAKLSAAYQSAGQQSVTGFWRVLEGLVPVEELDLIDG